MCAHLFVYVHINIYTCMYEWLCVFRVFYVHMCLGMSVSMSFALCSHVYMCLCICTCMSTDVCFTQDSEEALRDV